MDLITLIRTHPYANIVANAFLGGYAYGFTAAAVFWPDTRFIEPAFYFGIWLAMVRPLIPPKLDEE